MKTITTNLYSFDELSEEAKNKAIIEQINFEIEVADENSPFIPVFEEMERMHTPWFTAATIFHTPEYKNIIIENLRVNEYTFLSDGTMQNSRS